MMSDTYRKGEILKMIIDKKNVIVGVCNDGYYDFCKNWLISLKSHNLDEHIIVYALDQNIKDRLNKDFPKIKSILWSTQSSFSESSKEFVELVGEGWGGIVFKKFECVNYTLRHGHNVLFSDTDIIFQKNPLNYLINETKDDHFVIQTDCPKDLMWCTGFYYAKSCEQTINLTKFTPELCKDFNCDQPLLNARLSVESDLPLARVYSRNNVQKKVIESGWQPSNTLKWHRLSADLFPNGNKWFKMKQRLRKDPYIVHYNCLTGYENKVDTMKQYNHWFLK